MPLAIAAAESGTPAPDRNSATVTAVDNAIIRNFAVFRGEAMPASARPEALAARQGLFGMNTGLAREARKTATGASTYAVPGAGAVCLYGDEVGGACAPISEAVTTPALSVGICGPSIPRGQLIIAGLVADKIADVQVNLRNGTTAKGDVQQNVYTAYSPISAATLPVETTWTGADGVKHSQPLVVPNAVIASPCER